MVFLKKLWGSPQCLHPVFNMLPQGTSINIKTLIKESISEGTSEWGAPSTFRWLQQRTWFFDLVVGSAGSYENDTRTCKDRQASSCFLYVVVLSTTITIGLSLVTRHKKYGWLLPATTDGCACRGRGAANAISVHTTHQEFCLGISQMRTLLSWSFYCYGGS